jgi:hypothetical protein
MQRPTATVFAPAFTSHTLEQMNGRVSFAIDARTAECGSETLVTNLQQNAFLRIGGAQGLSSTSPSGGRPGMLRAKNPVSGTASEASEPLEELRKPTKQRRGRRWFVVILVDRRRGSAA